MGMDNSGTEPQDELDQDQQSLDQEQGITTEGGLGSVPPGPTMQQVLDSVSALAAQNRGLQSKIDTGLNAIRSDTQAWAESVVGDIRAQREAQANKEFLDGLDEDQRPMAEGLINRINQIQQPAPQPQPEPQGQPQTSLTQQVLDAWQPYQEFAERMGVNAGPGTQIQFTQFADANSMPDPNKLQAFQDHIAVLRVQRLGTAAPAAVPATQPNPQGDNPPVQDGNRVTGGNLRTADANRDALIAGDITTETFRENMRALGEPI